MTFLQEVSALVLTHDEAPNIGRTLDALAAFGEVVVLDSLSRDETPAIVARYDNARLFERPFDDHATQWNHGLALCDPRRAWTLALDADYFVTQELVAEIAALKPDRSISAYRASFRYAVNGRILRGSLYPPAPVLFRRDRARYVQSGHTQRLTIEGRIEPLKNAIVHDDRKPFSRWVSAQRNYAALEARYLLSAPRESLRLSQRLRLAGFVAPAAALVYALLIKGCLFDGWPGWFYALQRMFAETLIALEIIDLKLQAAREKAPR